MQQSSMDSHDNCRLNELNWKQKNRQEKKEEKEKKRHRRTCDIYVIVIFPLTNLLSDQHIARFRGHQLTITNHYLLSSAMHIVVVHQLLSRPNNDSLNIW